jgi:GntR family transcriptional regulator
VILEIDPRSGVPPYVQIGQQVAALVAGGVLAPGTRLPPIRQLANDLGVATGTVARAYRELESDGVLATAGRHGTVVASPPADLAAPPAEVLSAARRLADASRQAGANLEEALSAVRAAFASGSPS